MTALVTRTPIALVLSGGGARAAYQVGVLRAIAEALPPAAALPFPDASINLVYSSLALEQMEQVRTQALGEMARVSAQYTLMLEPFWDCNDTGLRRDYLLARDHFRGQIDELPGYGLEPILITDDLPGKIWLQPCLVVCRKRTAVR